MSRTSRFVTMHIERVGGGVMCRKSDVPSSWARTAFPPQANCSRCRAVYQTLQKSASSAVSESKQ